jgi:hypothetical protein
VVVEKSTGDFLERSRRLVYISVSAELLHSMIKALSPIPSTWKRRGRKGKKKRSVHRTLGKANL